jgi:hypothetical protein
MYGSCHYRTARFPVAARLGSPPDDIVLVRWNTYDDLMSPLPHRAIVRIWPGIVLA